MLKTHYALECIRTNWRFLSSFIFFLISALLIFPQNAQSVEAKLAWNSTETEHRVYYYQNTSSKKSVDVSGTTCTLNLANGKWYFQVTAINGSDESGPSNTAVGYTISSSAGQGGKITPEGDRLVQSNSNMEYTITAYSGYHIINVSIDGVPQGPITTHTFTNVTGNHTIVATFEQDSSGGSSSGDSSSGGSSSGGSSSGDSTTGDPIDLNSFITSVTASDYEPGNLPEHTLDGDPDTRWAAYGENSIQYNFSNPMNVESLYIAWRVGDSRVYTFGLQVFLDGNWTTIVSSEQSSGTTSELEGYYVGAVAESVRLIVYGNSDNLWANVTDVVIFGNEYTPPSPGDSTPGDSTPGDSTPGDSTPGDSTTSYTLQIVDVTASDYEYGNEPENTIDNDLGTRWSANGDGQYIVFDLGDTKEVHFVEIAWYNGNSRVAYFDIEISSNNTHWTRVYSGESSGTTLGLEKYDFDDVDARFIRIIGHGNSTSNWNSITEVNVNGREAMLPSNLLPIFQMTASADESDVGNTIDGNLDTRWSANGDGQWIKYDIGYPVIFDLVKIAFFNGDSRESYFDIEVSSDNIHWTPVYSGQSSGTTIDLEEHNFDDVEAQFLRIIGHGNSTNNWNSITEVEIYGR